MKSLCLTVLVLSLSFPALAKNKDKDRDQDLGPVATLNFVVIKDYNGKPIRNASVVLHLVNEKGKQDKGDLELKTDSDGKTSYEGVPYGKLRVQVLCPGFQTFGADYDIAQPTVEISIKLKRPTSQFSIYENQNGSQKPPDPNAKPQ